MRFRQIHLDFHTSERIPDIGTRFDAGRFAAGLKAAHVDSITLFSKCHHGVSYHPTEVGQQHPGLGFDLLRAQLDAVHGAGILAPIYISAAWDELAARTHPEWCVVGPDGTVPRHHAGPFGAGWANMDFATPYLDYLCRQVEEVMVRYPDGDGIFIDISFQLETLSAHARTRMEAEGLDWTDVEHRLRFAEGVQIEFFEKVTDAVRRHDPNKRLFYNFGHVRRGRREILKYFSHLEIESLPTAFWGYEHFPISARYIEPLGIEFLGQTGKFHHIWGEMGGYKTPDALVYECAAMVAQGARCLIGDHLHPSGELDESTYAAVGAAYAVVEAKEPWAKGSENLAEIGVLSVEGAHPPRLVGFAEQHGDEDEGVVRVLLESKLTFDVLDLDSDFSPYRLLILPDSIRITDTLKAKIDAYVADGGRVLLTGESGLKADGEGFAFDVGARHDGVAPFASGDFALPIPELRAPFVNKPLFMYGASQVVHAESGASLGAVYEPYFDRSPRAFSGHLNTPNRPDPAARDAGSRKGAYTYFAWPIFSLYKRVGAVAMLDIADRLIRLALGRPVMLDLGLPRAGRATLRRQPTERRSVLHLLHASPVLRGTLRGDAVQPIQDLVTLRDIAVEVETQVPVGAVRLVPGGETVPFEQEDGRVRFTVPALTGHQTVEIADA